MNPRIFAPIAFFFAAVLLIANAGGSSPYPINDDGFFYPSPGATLQFPSAHGSHPGFAIEWWYVTGHLTAKTPDESNYGFQITFFRSGAAHDVENTGPPGFADHGVMLSHLAVIDTGAQRFYHQEKLDRIGWNAAAEEGMLSLRHDGWTLSAADYDSNGDPTVFRFFGHIQSDLTLDLEFTPQKPRTIFGQNGISQKGASPDAASYYITFTRLAVNGSLQLRGSKFAVSGQAWMDHEFSSNQLEDGIAGWDWVQMQLMDGTEVMAFRLRGEDGTTSPFSAFNWIDAAGHVTSVDSAHFEWIDNSPWASPKTGGVYPIAPAIRVQNPVSGEEEFYQLKPLVAAAEIPGDLGGIPYWEGPVEIEDETGQKVGIGFLELTGYAESLAGRL